jgi:hypothetical protein
MEKRLRLELLATASLTEEECPDVDLLAAYTLGLLTGTEQLRVAAHVRSCPLCARDVEVCRPPAPRQRTFLARLLPFAPAEGRRGSVGPTNVRQYMAADILIDVTISPPLGDYWRMSGQVTRGSVGQGECRVTLHAKRRRYQQSTDTQGFFTFEMIPAGQYTLSVIDGQVKIQIRDIILSHDADG